MTKTLLQSDMFLNINPVCGFWKGEAELLLLSCFFFTSLFHVLQNEACVYCVFGGVLTLSESRFSLTLQLTHLFEISEHGPRQKRTLLTAAQQNFFGLCVVKTEALLFQKSKKKDLKSLAPLPSLNTQLKAHFFLNLHLTGGLLLL